MDAETQAQGRERVASLLIGRCNEAGLVRPRSRTVADHEAFQKRLVNRLAYMSQSNLETLAEVVIDNALGARHDIWPTETMINGFANALQKRPPQQCRIVTSWLASVEGPPAVAGGYEVELFWFLCDHPRPPLAYDLRQIKAEAAENARMIERISAAIERGTASSSDRATLEGYLKARRHVRQLVGDGQAARDAKARQSEEVRA